MPGRAENKLSEKGMAKGHGKREKETVHADMCVGSSNGDGVRFKVPNHPDKSVLKSPENS